MLRIALVINAMARAGAEVQVRDLALRFVARGHAVLVVSLVPFAAFEDELRAAGVETATVGMAKGRASLRGAAELVRTLARFRPDIVHAHLFAAIFACRMARLAYPPLARARFVETAHSGLPPSPGQAKAYAITSPLSDVWTCVCDEGVRVHERAGAVPAGRGRRVKNGLDVDGWTALAHDRVAARAELGLAEGAFVWLTVGSLRDDMKDVPNLLEATSRLAPTPRVVLVAGDGPLRPELEEKARALGVDGTARFLGLRGDVPRLMRAADAFVLASWTEALPMVLLEAGASELPSVATDVGGVRDIVLDGVTGRVVPARRPAELATAMAAVESLSDEERHRWARAARAHVVREFGLDHVADEWEALYHETPNVVDRLRGARPFAARNAKNGGQAHRRE